jgi:hypothetical protein
MQYILFGCASHPFDTKYENIVFSTKDRCIQQCRCTQQEEYKASMAVNNANVSEIDTLNLGTTSKH